MAQQDILNQILPKDHPSFGAQRALFMFGLGSGPTRILTVEAANPWAVLCLERMLLADGKVSDNCQVLQVVRDYRNVGTRDGLVEEVPFVDFMLDIVDMNRLMSEVVVMEAFKNALSDAERNVANIKLQMMQQVPVRDVFEGYQVSQSELVEAAPAAVTAEDQSDKLTAALVGLGFKKGEVRQFVASLGDQTRTEDLHSLLRQGLRALAA